MSLPYSEFPVYIGQVGVGSTPPNEINGYLPVTQASVSYNTSSSAKRKLGKSVDAADQFRCVVEHKSICASDFAS